MATKSVHLDGQEQLMLDKLAGVNQLPANTVLRLALRQLFTLADGEGRLPLVGRPMIGLRLDPVTSRPPEPPPLG